MARILALLMGQPGIAPRVAMAAPTGKAAARLQAAVQAQALALGAGDRHDLPTLSASTLHRLLGWLPGRTQRFRHDRDNRLPFDVVVVDETSMVSLTMMARLLEAVRPDARLILVGDPDQLASVEAGAVLADLVAGLTGGRSAPPVPGWCCWTGPGRFGGAIADLAAAVRAGDGDRAMAVLGRAVGEVTLVDPEDAASDPVEGAVRPDVVGWRPRSGRRRTPGTPTRRCAGSTTTGCCAGIGPARAACGNGPGVSRTGWPSTICCRSTDSGIRRPVLVTANDYSLQLFNGDIGVAVRIGEQLRVAFSRHGRIVDFAPGRLAEVQTVHAMTVHRSQGSQFDRVSVVRRRRIRRCAPGNCCTPR